MDYQNRRSPYIIIPIIMIALLITALICLGVYTYNLKSELSEDKKQKTEINEQNNLNSENLGDINLNKEEVSVELNKEDSIVNMLIQKIDFPTYAIASIYKTKSFNLETIPNDLILRLGWANAEKELIKNNIDNLGEYKQTVTKEKFDESVTNIFGTELNYLDDSFTNIDVPTFHAYAQNRGVINYFNNLYTANYAKGSGDAAFIQQEVQKVLKYSDKIELYVKTAFIDLEYDNTQREFNYIIYKDFNTGKFEGMLGKTTSSELNNSYVSDENKESSFNSNSEILKVEDELNTYVYTFTIDKINNSYYLSGFDKAE